MQTLHLVLDTSVVLGALFQDEQDEYSLQVLASLGELSAAVPQLWHLEMANILSRALRAKRITEPALQECWTRLAVLELQTLPLTPDPRYWTERAYEWDVTSYDACYLDLARQQRLPLASKDKKMTAIAKRIGVELFTPSNVRRTP